MRVLSGIQPTGNPHLGNYFGAIQQHIQLQDQGNDCFYFIADYHTLTTVHDANLVREYTNEVALTYLALGLDPDKSVFYRQSDVPEVTELAWMLASVTGMGLLERAHSYKDKTAKGITPSVGLFFYPALMAADILIVKSDVVPVGQDQVQHLEMTQDMAGSFNHAFGKDVLVRPEVQLSHAPKVPGIDGDKMSKSYNNTIEIFAEGKALKKPVMSIVTTSIEMGQPLPTENDVILELYRLFSTEDEVEAMVADYKSGGIGYGDAKKRLLEKVDTHFAPARERRRELAANPDYIRDVLDEGGRRVRPIVRQTIEECRQATGLD